MIAIVFSHALDLGILRSWIYTFRIPVFLLISGHLLNYNSDSLPFVKKIIKQLMVCECFE